MEEGTEKGRGGEAGTPMNALERGCRGRIVSVNAEPGVRARLAELGYFPGAIVEKKLVSPLGDPCAYMVRGVMTAIRRELAACLTVEAPAENTGGRNKKSGVRR